MAHRPRKTNREAAAQLSISEGTEEAHVQHILGKLDVNTLRKSPPRCSRSGPRLQIH